MVKKEGTLQTSPLERTMPFTDSDESARLLLQVMLLEMGLSAI